ncbi:MAG: hypothetical protein ACR2RE_07655, partial [Geminicoccaceae bacterium]
PKTAPKAKPRAKVKTTQYKPKTHAVKAVAANLLAAQDKVTADEILQAAKGQDERVTKHDVANGLRALAKKGEARIVETGVWSLPAQGNGAAEHA